MPGPGGGVPCQVQPGGYPARFSWGYPAGGYPAGGTLPGGTQVGYCPGQVRTGGSLPGGTLWGGTQLGKQKEYSLHGGRYASCVHTGGLSCFEWE